MGELLFRRVSHECLLRDRSLCSGPSDPTSAAPQSTTLSAPQGGKLVRALGATGADPSTGACACLRRELSGEPDAGNLHLRFDEGRGTFPVPSYSTGPVTADRKSTRLNSSHVALSR